ncbi:MAG: hypothetical protein U5R31_08420 [Acidimicrobiia bacterium]|nr:hypothetical protein [Acidimicrobiia bacterium]
MVDTATDAVDAVPGDGLCDTGDGTCSLRAAVQETNATPGADTVTIAAGVDPTLSITGTGEDAAATGDLDITDDLTLDGNGATVDADGIDRVLELHGVEATITRLTVIRGDAEQGRPGSS